MTKNHRKKSSEEEYEVVPINETDFFYTFDLALASSLVCLGFSLVSLDRENLRKVQFVFRRAEGIDETIEAYWADTLQVRARSYFDSMKMLKNRLHSE